MKIISNTINLILINLFFIFSFSLVAQPNIEWTKNYGGAGSDSVFEILPTSNNGYILVGHSSSSDDNNGSVDVWMLKIDSIGDIEWEQNHGGSDHDSAKEIIPTTDGGYMLACYTRSIDGDVTGMNRGGTDVWLIKTDAVGAIEWQQNYGGSNIDWLETVHQSDDGKYLLGGITKSEDFDVDSNYGYTDGWLVKLGACTLENQISVLDNVISSNSMEYSYQWIDCNDNFNPIQNETNSEFSPVENGNYAVIISDSTCTIRSECIDFTLVSLNEKSQNNIFVFPNPVQQNIIIEQNYIQALSIKVINLQGQLESSHSANTQSTAINLSDLESGIYFLVISNIDTTFYKKIIKI